MYSFLPVGAFFLITKDNITYICCKLSDTDCAFGPHVSDADVQFDIPGTDFHMSSWDESEIVKVLYWTNLTLHITL